jgi:hypothetical protein
MVRSFVPPSVKRTLPGVTTARAAADGEKTRIPAVALIVPVLGPLEATATALVSAANPMPVLVNPSDVTPPVGET